MRLFLSWSGSQSYRVALALRSWMPNVVQVLEPWMSSEDIAKGAGWLLEIDAQLQSTTHGVVCVVAGNEVAPWLNFEAGALAKQAGQRRVCVALLGLEPTDLTGPLKGFQATNLLNPPDVLKLMNTLNDGLPEGVRLTRERLQHAFDREWDGLARELNRILETGSQDEHARPVRTERELIEEVLDLVRALGREQALRGEGLPNRQDDRRTFGSALGFSSEIDAVLAPTVARFPISTPVIHESLGVGVVVESQIDEKNEIATIDFAERGRKRLIVRYAPLEVFDGNLPEELQSHLTGELARPEEEGLR